MKAEIINKEFEAFWKEYIDLLVFTKKPDKGRKAEQFLYDNIDGKFHDVISRDLKILRFVKDTDIDKFYTRIHGKFKSLVGRVLKHYNVDKHMCEAFDIPTDWLVEVQIDFHLGTPQAISYYTADPQQRNFVIREIWDNLSAEEISDDIIRCKLGKTWNIKEAYIDPLSKGDVGYLKNRFGKHIEDSFSILKNKLKKHGIKLDVASKDKDSGIKNLERWLEGPNKMPTLFYFDTLNQSPNYGHFHELQRWIYDENMKPAKEFDHFMECDYRHTLTGFKWKEPDKPYVPTPPQPTLAGQYFTGNSD